MLLNDRMQIAAPLQGAIVFLTGFMASGKSHFGRQLAELMQVPFYDLDAFIERRQGKSISSLFQSQGEQSFRTIEREALEDIVGEIRSRGPEAMAVVATGGGAACHGDNMNWMNAQGITVWMNPPYEVLMHRLSRETSQRPLVQGLEGEALEAFVRSRLSVREPFYRLSNYEIREPNPVPSLWLKKI